MEKPLETPESETKFHARAAWVWFILGLLGLAQFGWALLHDPELVKETLDTPIAASIPVLYFISVYANVVGHWSGYQAAKAEVEEDGKIKEIMEELDKIKEKLGI